MKKIKYLLLIFLLELTFMPALIFAQEPDPPPGDGMDQIDFIPPDTSDQNPLLSSALNQLLAAWSAPETFDTGPGQFIGFEFDDNRVLVMITALDEESAASIAEQLPEFGGEVFAHYKNWIDAWIPIGNLEQVAALQGVGQLDRAIETLPADSVGLYWPAASGWFMRDHNSFGVNDYAFPYGPPGFGLVPIAGDWNGDGRDTVGFYYPANSWFFRNYSGSPSIAKGMKG